LSHPSTAGPPDGPVSDSSTPPGRRSVFVADHLGKQAGTCMTVKDAQGVGGVYWVAVLAEHRRAGIGRALMLAAMRELAGLPMVLCATSQGAPL